MTNALPLPPYLTDVEIAEICAPLKMPAAQRRYLERLGMIVKAKPNGRPLVARAEFDRVLVGGPIGTPPTAAGTQPDLAGLEAWAARRKPGNGKSA